MARRLHRVDIAAALKKRHGSVQAFERARGLPLNAVSDTLRGRSSAPTREAIAAELGISTDRLLDIDVGTSVRSDKADNTGVTPKRHRLNADAA